MRNKLRINNTIKKLSILLCFASFILLAVPVSASDYLWLRPEKQTTLSSGNAACEVTLMKNSTPIKINENKILSANYHCHSLKGQQKNYTMPLTINHYDNMTTFTAESAFIAFCEIQAVIEDNNTIYSLQCSIPLFGNGNEDIPVESSSVSKTTKFPTLKILKNNLPYYFPATGEKLIFNYTAPFLRQNTTFPFIIMPDGTKKEPDFITYNRFSYTHPAAKPFAIAADTSIKQLIIVQPDIAPNGKTYCTALTICLTEPYTRYIAIKEGWLLFIVAIAVMGFIAYRILRRPCRHANK